jgi:hypothetical protein
MSPPPLVLYEGSAGIVAAGTAPYYGGGLKLFPFARMTPNGMHLRVGRIHPLEGVWNIPRIFRGTYRNHGFGCLDFCGPQFVVEVLGEEEYPVQHSGESVGRCTRVSFQVMGDEDEEADDGNQNDSTATTRRLPPPIKFVTLLPPRLVVEE